jgi:hypothetical protein
MNEVFQQSTRPEKAQVGDIQELRLELLTTTRHLPPACGRGGIQRPYSQHRTARVLPPGLQRFSLASLGVSFATHPDVDDGDDGPIDYNVSRVKTDLVPVDA